MSKYIVIVQQGITNNGLAEFDTEEEANNYSSKLKSETGDDKCDVYILKVISKESVSINLSN